MAEVNGYAIIRNAIPTGLAQEAADTIPGGLITSVKREKFTEFKVPPVCVKIREQFIKEYGKHSDLAQLLETQSVPPPKSINIGIFHETNSDPTKMKTGLKGEVYVTVALTDLSPANGLFIFLAKSHKHTSESASAVGWEENHIDLKAGDAVLWRGDLVYLHSSGGGGKFETLVFGG
ncbi:uncharacterized protein RAG0_17038 [Rhynchosporium agropyri]|uniref:Uncharacterized protein n=2 Tax=Rhynchosporium TaxID=38037 RepID=A0A1E1MW82_RHYSE|nr:uncharacterized protein RAG0_17038 [Rhynchosporium agropyri]CZT53332.1 uncharacterized protein RSE6_14826 [Rhynchosporium secalis]